LRRFVRPVALTATTLMALLAAALWVDNYFHYINVDVGLWHVAPLEQTSREATVADASAPALGPRAANSQRRVRGGAVA